MLDDLVIASRSLICSIAILSSKNEGKCNVSIFISMGRLARVLFITSGTVVDDDTDDRYSNPNDAE